MAAVQVAPTVTVLQLLMDSDFPLAVAEAPITLVETSAGEMELNVHTPALTVVVPI